MSPKKKPKYQLSEFGVRVRKIMQDEELKHLALATRIGVSAQRLHRILAQKYPTEGTIGRIASALDTPVEELWPDLDKRPPFPHPGRPKGSQSNRTKFERLLDNFFD